MGDTEKSHGICSIAVTSADSAASQSSSVRSRSLGTLAVPHGGQLDRGGDDESVRSGSEALPSVAASSSDVPAPRSASSLSSPVCLGPLSVPRSQSHKALPRPPQAEQPQKRWAVHARSASSNRRSDVPPRTSA